jgi:hypothetical protein
VWLGTVAAAMLTILTLQASTASADVVADASCKSSPIGSSLTGPRRFAQTFTVQQTGRMVAARFLVNNFPDGTDFIIELRTLDSVGTPTSSVVASATVLDVQATGTGANAMAVTGLFPNPPAVNAGEAYALSITDFPTASNYGIRQTIGDVCSGTPFFDGNADGSFMSTGGDFWLETFVDNSQPPVPDTAAPETTITKAPTDRTKQKIAVFEFASSEPGSTFQCSFDGEPFGACNSPLTRKVSKGKHTFQVRARDAAGNADPTEATDDWVVKKKRKK